MIWNIKCIILLYSTNDAYNYKIFLQHVFESNNSTYIKNLKNINILLLTWTRENIAKFSVKFAWVLITEPVIIFAFFKLSILQMTLFNVRFQLNFISPWTRHFRPKLKCSSCFHLSKNYDLLDPRFILSYLRRVLACLWL